MNLTVAPDHDEQLKQCFAGLAIHLTTRPASESVAWTIHMQSQRPYSLFLTGNSSEEYLVGRILYDNVSHTDQNIFHSQVVRDKGEFSRSTVRSEDSAISSLFETFYEKSEQLPAKLRFIDNSDKAVALFALTDFDQAWFKNADPIAVLNDIENIQYDLVNKTGFRFLCSCSPQKLLPLFQTMKIDEIEELYAQDSHLIVDCPRCGKKFQIAKEDLTPS